MEGPRKRPFFLPEFYRQRRPSSAKGYNDSACSISAAAPSPLRFAASSCHFKAKCRIASLGVVAAFESMWSSGTSPQMNQRNDIGLLCSRTLPMSNCDGKTQAGLTSISASSYSSDSIKPFTALSSCRRIHACNLSSISLTVSQSESTPAAWIHLRERVTQTCSNQSRKLPA